MSPVSVGESVAQTITTQSNEAPFAKVSKTRARKQRIKGDRYKERESFQWKIMSVERQEAWLSPGGLAGSSRSLCPGQRSKPLLTSCHCKESGPMPQCPLESDFSELSSPPGMCKHFKLSYKANPQTLSMERIPPRATHPICVWSNVMIFRDVKKPRNSVEAWGQKVSVVYKPVIHSQLVFSFQAPCLCLSFYNYENKDKMSTY